MSALLASLSPQAAVLLLTAGLICVAWELNRPGSILPGAVGTLCVLVGVAILSRFSLHLWAVLLLLAAIGFLGGNLVWALPMWLLGLAGLAMVAGLRLLLATPPAIGWPEALVCGALVSGGAAVLSRIAFRARRAKQVN